MTTKENEKSKKRIFWFEDDAHSLSDYYKKLSEEYDISIGSHKNLIEQERNYSFDLVLLDLLVYESSFKHESNEVVKNIRFEGTHWTEIGVEFLRLLRDGKYEGYGFPKDITVIAVTAHVDADIQETVESLGVCDFLLKPIAIDKLKISIEKALNPLNNSKD